MSSATTRVGLESLFSFRDDTHSCSLLPSFSIIIISSFLQYDQGPAFSPLGWGGSRSNRDEGNFILFGTRLNTTQLNSNHHMGIIEGEKGLFFKRFPTLKTNISTRNRLSSGKLNPSSVLVLALFVGFWWLCREFSTGLETTPLMMVCLSWEALPTTCCLPLLERVCYLWTTNPTQTVIDSEKCEAVKTKLYFCQLSLSGAAAAEEGFWNFA